MKLYHAVLCIVTLLLSFNLSASANDPHNVGKDTNRTGLFAYMEQISSQLGCYFTVESVHSESGQNILNTVQILSDPKVKTVASLVEKLSKDVPQITVKRDTENPLVVHLIEKSIFSDPNYPLNKKTSLSYSGRLMDLPDLIGSNLKTTLTTKHAIFGPVTNTDFTTTVSVNSVDEPVRTILTKCLPFKSYGAYLWCAVSWKEDNIKFVTVDFGGPRSKRSIEIPKKP